jgi:colicin import membrane protein
MSSAVSRSLLLAMLALIVMAGFGEVAWTDSRSNAIKRARAKAARNDRAKQADFAEAVQKARGEIQKDRDSLAEAAIELEAAKSALRMAGQKKSNAIDDLREREEKKAGLAKARAAQEFAKSVLDAGAKPVLEALKKTPEYAEAMAKAEAARKAIDKIQDDASLSEQERKQRLLDASGDSFAVSTLERTTLRKDPSTQALVEKLEVARKVVTELNQNVKTSVESDPKVRAAEDDIDEVRRSIEAAEARIAGIRVKIAAAEARLDAGMVDRSAKASAPKAGTSKKSGS